MSPHHQPPWVAHPRWQGALHCHRPHDLPHTCSDELDWGEGWGMGWGAIWWGGVGRPPRVCTEPTLSASGPPTAKCGERSSSSTNFGRAGEPMRSTRHVAPASATWPSILCSARQLATRMRLWGGVSVFAQHLGSTCDLDPHWPTFELPSHVYHRRARLSRAHRPDWRRGRRGSWCRRAPNGWASPHRGIWPAMNANSSDSAENIRITSTGPSWTLSGTCNARQAGVDIPTILP